MFLFSLFLLIVADVIHCKPDYIFNENVDGWLKVHRIPTTWNEAYLKCHFEGAVIASPIDEQMIKALFDVHAQFSPRINDIYYLGTHAQFSEGDFFSIEGIPLADMQIKWSDSVYGFKHEDCLTMRYLGDDYEMSTSKCSERYPYICYKKRESNTKLNECGTFDNEYKFNNCTGSCYKLHQSYNTWSRAHMICAAEGGHLAILNNEQEAVFVKNMIPVRDGSSSWDAIFIGVRDLNNDGTWLTIHGEGLEKVYHNWATGQPDNAGGMQHCATLLRIGSMDDNSCDFRTMFVCEKDPNTTRFGPTSLQVY